MRNVIAVVTGAVLTVVLAVPVFSAEMTVKGEVVDVACSLAKQDADRHPTTQGPQRGDPGRGAGHANCAMACAKKGQPVGILTADAVYNVVGDYAASNNAKMLDFVAKSVIVTGEVTEKDGVKSINVKSIKLAN